MQKSLPPGMFPVQTGAHALKELVMEEAIDVAERNSQAAAAFSLAGLDEARKRAHALLLVLLAGGGALGALGLARAGDALPLAAAALVMAVHWFALAAYVAWRANTSAEVRSWATAGLLAKWPEWQDYVKALNAEAAARGDAGPPASAVLELRMEAIRNCELAAGEYRTASKAAMRVVDTAYRWAACVPLSGAIAAALAGRVAAACLGA